VPLRVATVCNRKLEAAAVTPASAKLVVETPTEHRASSTDPAPVIRMTTTPAFPVSDAARVKVKVAPSPPVATRDKTAEPMPVLASSVVQAPEIPLHVEAVFAAQQNATSRSPAAVPAGLLTVTLAVRPATPAASAEAKATTTVHPLSGERKDQSAKIFDAPLFQVMSTPPEFGVIGRPVAESQYAMSRAVASTPVWM
jgi:hypothetical protein